MMADVTPALVAPEYFDEPLSAALVYRDLNTPNAIGDLVHALTHLDALVDTVFSNVSSAFLRTIFQPPRGSIRPP